MNPLSSVGIAAAAGIPPRTMDASWSTADGFLLLLVYVAAFVVGVMLVAWIDARLRSRRLFRDIYRELGIGKPTR